MNTYYAVASTISSSVHNTAASVDDCQRGACRMAYDTPEDAISTADWLNERAAGYPSLKKFEGGKLWPNTYRNGLLVYEA